MLTRGVMRWALASFSLAFAALFTAAKAQNPTTPGAIPNPGTYQGSMELQRQSDERDRQLREEHQRQQQLQQQQYQSYPQRRDSRGDNGGGQQSGGGRPPRVMPDFAANDRALAAIRRHDYATALRIVRPLAAHGDMVAEYTLGAMYDRGMGFPENHPMALQWYRRSAGEGYSQSMRNLGTMYRNGEAGGVNYVEAYRWYSLSLTHLVPGEADADAVQELRQDLKDVSVHMSAAQIAQAKKLALETNAPFLR